MRPPKINDRALLKLIDSQKMSQSEAAKELCVSRQAVSKRLQELRGKTTKVVAAKKILEVVDRKNRRHGAAIKDQRICKRTPRFTDALEPRG